jgi:hypothetical protein
MTDSTQRTLGEHSAKLEHLEKMVEQIDENVKLLIAEKNQAQGSRKTILTAATVLGTIGGGLASTVLAKFFK